MKKAVVVLAHGSRKPEAKLELERITQRLSSKTALMTRLACMQLAKPSFEETIDSLANGGYTDILVVPLFLTNGTHMQEDIPDLIKKAADKHIGLNIRITACLWPDPLIINLLEKRVRDSYQKPFAAKTLEAPQAIEDESFNIIENLIKPNGFNKEEFEVVKRLVHTSGDPSLADMVTFTTQAVAKGIEAIKKGLPVITDVNMVATGINKNLTSSFSVDVHTWITNKDVSIKANRIGKTRAFVAIEKLSKKYPEAIIAIGNAPTALLKVAELITRKEIKPSLVIAMPVGFVGTVQSKKAIKQTNAEFICVEGTRGGSNLAAASVNALLKLAAASLARGENK
jgi:precorrin-8X/cobalt-precorrin-8 methylmutase